MSQEFSRSRRNLLVGAAVGLAGASASSQGLAPQATGDAACPAARAGAGLSLTDFGAMGDGTDQTAAFVRARGALQAGTGGTIYLPPGNYGLGAVLDTRNVHLVGAGNAATVLRAAVPGVPILRATDADASWVTLYLSDLGFEGASSRQGVGLRLGNDRLTTHAEYTGRLLLERLRFANLTNAVERPFGNIGVDFVDCTFQAAEFHLWSQGQSTKSAANDIMHAGALTLTRGSMQGAQRASIYVDGRDVAGSGQIVLDSVRFEANPGWILYLKNFNSRGPQPGILVRSCWNENNYTANSVNIDGASTAPGFAKLANVPVCTFEDTPIGPLVLENSHVITRGCNLDQLSSVMTDARSTLTHHDARMFTGTAVGLVRTIGHLENTAARTSLNSPWFPMPLPVAPRLFDNSVLLVSDGQQSEAWFGTTDRASSRVAEVAVPWLGGVQQLSIPGGAVLISPLSSAVAAGKWLVIQFIARLRSGPPPEFYLTGTAGVGGACTLRDIAWRTYTSVVQNDGTAIERVGFYLRNGARRPTVIQLGGYAVTRWGDSQDALAYANSLLFPRR